MRKNADALDFPAGTGAEHKPAHHVREACARGTAVQPKMTGQQPAVHVQKMIAAAAQLKIAAEARPAPRPAHVQAAIAQVNRAPQALTSRQQPEIHAQAALASTTRTMAPPVGQFPTVRVAQARLAGPVPPTPTPHIAHALASTPMRRANLSPVASVLQTAKSSSEKRTIKKYVIPNGTSIYHGASMKKVDL